VKPGNQARLARAEELVRRGDLAGARRDLQRILAAAPADRAAWKLLRAVAARQGDWTALRAVLEREIRLDPPGPRRDYDEGHLRLLFGDLARGWELYEARLQLPELAAPWHFSKPRWNGEPFPGRTLLLFWEQGFGDTLMFVRYAARAKDRGGRVVVLAQRELADLVATCPGVDQTVPHLDPIPPYDLQAPLLSLPRLLGGDLASLPAGIPYLDVPARVPHRQALAQVLAASAGRTRVGVVWAGSRTHKRDGERSLPPAALAPLGDLPGVAWHSFQLGAEAAPPLPELVHLAPLLEDFSDTAYALSGMDLVISADTALTHLAGAMGIPTLVLLAFGPDFRWMLGRADSPWYPSLRLYRQPTPGDWETVVRAVLRDLSPSPNP
jgi:hypothetical protein